MCAVLSSGLLHQTSVTQMHLLAPIPDAASLESAQLHLGPISTVSLELLKATPGLSTAQCARSFPLACPPHFCPVPRLQPCSPGAQNPFSVWPEKSVYSVEQIGSFPSRKKLALEISLPRLRVISHLILQPQLCFCVP